MGAQFAHATARQVLGKRISDCNASPLLLLHGRLLTLQWRRKNSRRLTRYDVVDVPADHHAAVCIQMRDIVVA
jgi:hypothetical protein